MSELGPVLSTSGPGPEGNPSKGPALGLGSEIDPGILQESSAGLNGLDLEGPEILGAPQASIQELNEALSSEPYTLQERVQTNPNSTEQELDIEQFLSPDAVSAIREMTFIDQFRDLGDRIANNPTPTDEEWNMGAYKEEIEPQVRDAAMLMRQKGYNTGSSGFWGQDHIDQVMDIATPIDDNAKARLAEHDIKVTDTGVRFTPENPSNLESVKKTWDLIADILPDLGKHADPAENAGADDFRYAMKHGLYTDYMESWVWQTGALNGNMQPLTVTMLREGFSFGDDVHEPARLAEAKFHERERLAQQEKEQGR